MRLFIGICLVVGCLGMLVGCGTGDALSASDAAYDTYDGK